jgi:hypothetical protein
MMACAFSHTALEPVEHRWGWGQYFGPPSTDGAWFDLYRHMLLHEQKDGTLWLLQATPRQWLEDGKQIHIERAPTWYGKLNLATNSRAQRGELEAIVELAGPKRPATIVVRLRHPGRQALRSVSVNGQAWTNFDAATECVRISAPDQPRYVIVARY